MSDQPDSRPIIELPAPRTSGSLSLEEVLAGRRSIRQFSPESLTLAEISQLLWAAQGITESSGLRTAPSAGALYPLELYVATAEGLFHHEVTGHRLLKLSADDLRPGITRVALRQSAPAQAAATFVFTADYRRTEAKYSLEESRHYVPLDAGHSAQNLLLQAVVLDLGAVPLGAFYADKLQKVLGLPAEHRPLYLVAVGRLPR
ncbi:MAG: SagB/ThcOx family dehydrogenase [bacterium]